MSQNVSLVDFIARNTFKTNTLNQDIPIINYNMNNYFIKLAFILLSLSIIGKNSHIVFII